MNDTLRMTCPHCTTVNQPEAVYCNKCGQPLSAAATPAPSLTVEPTLWRQFIGPRADTYLERFRLFREGTRERFTPTWHWPAFGVGWIWYLYRKMYLHAAIFLFGGLLPMVLGAGLVGVVVWNLFAAASANYLYYMHIKLTLAVIQQRAGSDAAVRDGLIRDAGGIQPYVWWLGAGLMALAIGAGIMETPEPSTPPATGDPV